MLPLERLHLDPRPGCRRPLRARLAPLGRFVREVFNEAMAEALIFGLIVFLLALGITLLRIFA